MVVNYAMKWRQRIRCKTGRGNFKLCYDGLRDHIEYQGKIILLLDKGPPSQPGIIVKLEKNENVEKPKK